MASQYDAVAQRVLAAIEKKGAAVTFPGVFVGTAPVYDPATDTWSGDTEATAATGRAVQVKGDPDRFAALGLTLINSVTLLVAASGLAVTPASGMTIQWASVNYVVKDTDPVAPDGVPILWTLIGKA